MQYSNDAELQLLQELKATCSQQSNADFIAGLEENNSLVASQGSTQKPSVAQGGKRQFKKPRKIRAESSGVEEPEAKRICVSSELESGNV